MNKIKLSLLVGITSLIASLVIMPSSFAATPPDECFDFDAGTILMYYSNENDDAGQPACTKEVDIPAQIGGIDVEIVGTSAF